MAARDPRVLGATHIPSSTLLVTIKSLENRHGGETLTQLGLDVDCD